MKKTIMKILNIFKIVLLAILIIFVIATAYQKVIPNYPSVFGFRTFSIITSSMEPKLKIGDVILIKEQKTSSYKVGDIITFKGMSGDLSGKIVTHEIVGVTNFIPKELKIYQMIQLYMKNKYLENIYINSNYLVL